MTEWQTKQLEREAADRAAGKVKRVERQAYWHRWWYPPTWSTCHACCGRGWAYDDEGLELYCECEGGQRRKQAESGGGAILVDWPTDEESL